MKKFAFLIMSFVLYSCALTDNGVETKGNDIMVPVEFNINLGTVSDTKSGIPGPITDAFILDSLVQDIRVYVFNQSNTCEAYADFTSLRLSQSPKLRMTIATGQKTIMFITNVCDNKVTNLDVIGKRPDEIHIFLEKNTYQNSNYRRPARQYFYTDITMDIQPDVLNKKDISLVRIVSQLESTVTMTKIWETDVDKNKIDTLVYSSSQPYLYGFRALSVQFVPYQYGLDDVPDLLMGNESISLVSEEWVNNKILRKAKNLVLSFPTDKTNTRARLLLAGLVNKNHPKFVPNPADIELGTDTIVRFWSYTMQNHLKSNKRMQLTVTGLVGLGAPTPISPDHYATIEFTILIEDWDPAENFMSANKDDIID